MHIIYACDIGSTLGKQPSFAWARLVGGDDEPPEGGRSISQLVEHLSRDLASGATVALGFEAPLFIPVPPAERPECLSQRRENEGQRSWSAPAGRYVATLAMHQAPPGNRTVAALNLCIHGRCVVLDNKP